MGTVGEGRTGRGYDGVGGVGGRDVGRTGRRVADLAALDVGLSEERTPAIKESQKAEANLVLKGVTLHARAHAADMRTAIGEVAEELERQVVRHREKVRGHRKVGTPTIRTTEVPEEA